MPDLPMAVLAHLQPAKIVADLMAQLSTQDEVCGLLWFGSSYTGNMTAGSDIDLYVLTTGSEAWIEGRVIEEIDVELHFGPTHFWESMLERPVPTVVHAFEHGGILYDEDACVSTLVTQAQTIWKRGPMALTEPQRQARRFHLYDQLNDLKYADEGVAAKQLSTALVAYAIDAWFAEHQQWKPKWSMMGEILAQNDPEMAQWVETFYGGECQPEVAILLGEHVLTQLGGPLRVYQTPKRQV